jgi:hypothetical protein
MRTRFSPRQSGRIQWFAWSTFALSFLATGHVVTPSSAAAQKGSVRLLVLDDETGDPVVEAFIRIKGRTPLFTDTKGRVMIDSLTLGRHEAELGAIGYEPRKEYLFVQEGTTPERRIGLTFTGEKLPDLIVEARQERLYPRYADFHRRSQQGAGFYITWREIKAKGFSRLGDVMRTVRGVEVRCPTQDCIIEMARSACLPRVWVDGRPSDYFGANMPVGDVYGIEVYRGASEMPAEFIGNGMCGAVIIWTKNRPYR